LTIAHERSDDGSDVKLRGLLDAGDPRAEVCTAWHAKEVLRSVCDHSDPATALELGTQRGVDLQDDTARPKCSGSAARSDVGATRSPPGMSRSG